MNFGCTVDTVDTVDTNFGVNCVNCVNCAPSSKRSPFAVAMHYQQRQRQQQQQQQQQEQREGIKTITTTNTHTQTAITILCPGASPALRSPSISQTNKRKIMKIESKVKSVTSASPSPAILLHTIALFSLQALHPRFDDLIRRVLGGMSTCFGEWFDMSMLSMHLADIT